jgi:hypothetical protein
VHDNSAVNGKVYFKSFYVGLGYSPCLSDWTMIFSFRRIYSHTFDTNYTFISYCPSHPESRLTGYIKHHCIGTFQKRTPETTYWLHPYVAVSKLLN